MADEHFQSDDRAWLDDNIRPLLHALAWGTPNTRWQGTADTYHQYIMLVCVSGKNVTA